MNEETFLAALRENPSDQVTWLALADWLDDSGQGPRAELLRLMRQLRASAIKGRDSIAARVAELLTAGVKPVVVEMTNSIGMRFTLVPPGRFLMGSSQTEAKRKPDEHQHEVEITQPFWLGVFQVTQRQWKKLTRSNPSWFCRGGGGRNEVKGLRTDDFPVEQILWRDTQTFLKQLAATPQRDGWEYRLPTEAEWEYACRGAGMSSEPFLFGAPSPSYRSIQANFDGNYRYGLKKKTTDPYLRRTCKVGSYEPNPLGIYDMHGNVWEWCHDWYGEDYYLSPDAARDPVGPPSGEDHLIRGGSWDSVAESCRAANRRHEDLDYRNSVLGFRVAFVRCRE